MRSLQATRTNQAFGPRVVKSIELGADEPDHFFTRGRLLFKAERYREAVTDFTRVLELCEKYNSDYYRDAAHLFRADAYVRLTEFAKAKADCDRVSDKGPVWTDQLRTKESILADCR
jgi:tetratricopeptide (TPR) repeat protein